MIIKKRIPILLILAVIGLLFLSGCANVLQELTIREDGSGYLRINIGVDSDLYPQFQESIPEGLELDNLLSGLLQDENVIDVTQDQYEAEGRTWDSIQLEMADVLAVFTEERRIGPMLMSIDEDEGIYTFSQLVDLNLSTVTIPGINLLDLSSAEYTMLLNTPQIVDTNGVQRAAGSSTWKISLRDILQGGESVYLEADYVLEPYEGVFIPWDLFFSYVVIGFLAMGGLAILLVIIVNTTGKREKPREYKF
jgi:hypothetical protein